MGLTKVFFTSDVDGSEICFLKFLNAAKFYQAQVLILGGDITGKMIVPIVEQEDGTYLSEFLGETQVIKTIQERDDLAKKIRNSGFYPYPTTLPEMEKLTNDKSLRDKLFSEVMAEEVKQLRGRRGVEVVFEHVSEASAGGAVTYSPSGPSVR
jgi:Icc-related predicted phosphoesterase